MLMADKEKLKGQIHNLANDLKSGQISWSVFDEKLEKILSDFFIQKA